MFGFLVASRIGPAAPHDPHLKGNPPMADVPELGDRVFLVDASPYIFRAFFSVPDKLRTPDGKPKNALHGFAAFLLKLVDDYDVRRLALTFDRSLNSSFRNEIYPEYKAQREKPPADLEAQLRWCEAFGAALGMRCFVDETYEADDLIAALCGPLVEAGHDVVVVSSDKDLCQLVSDRVSLLDFAKGELYGVDEVVAKFGVRPSQMVDYLGLAGDAVDNIPGVPGVGKKTAVALLSHFESLDAIYGALDQVATLPIRGAKSLAGRLEQHREVAFLSRRLATVAVEAPAHAAAADLELLGVDENVLDPLADALGIERTAARARTLFERRS